MNTGIPPAGAFKAAFDAARRSPCAKSKRGVSAYVKHDHDTFVIGAFSNGPPSPMKCGTSTECFGHCGQWCVHAEMRAIRNAVAWEGGDPEGIRVARFGRRFSLQDVALVHIKVVGYEPVASADGPSCWQCSREILDAGIGGIWLYEITPIRGPEGPLEVHEWHYYPAEEFHRLTWENVLAAEEAKP